MYSEFDARTKRIGWRRVGTAHWYKMQVAATVCTRAAQECALGTAAFYFANFTLPVHVRQSARHFWRAHEFGRAPTVVAAFEWGPATSGGWRPSHFRFTTHCTRWYDTINMAAIITVRIPVRVHVTMKCTEPYLNDNSRGLLPMSDTRTCTSTMQYWEQ